MRNPLLASCLVFALIGVGRSADLESGPEKGAKIPALRVYDCTGENKGKTIDYAALRKGKVTIYLFLPADKFDRPMHRFIKKLDQTVNGDFEDVYLVAVWLTADEPATKERLPKIQMSVNYSTTALCSFGGTDPKDWNVNGDAHLSVVVAAKGKVAARFAYKSVNDTDVPNVVNALAKVATKK
jgi:hypothetical protein